MRLTSGLMVVVMAMGMTTAPLSAQGYTVNTAGLADRTGGNALLFSRSDIRALQEELQRLGYDPGPNDGIHGPRTRAAAEAFQRDIGRPATGLATESLLATARNLTPGDLSPAVAQTEAERALPQPVLDSLREELARHGYAPGPGPGITPELRSAIRQYQNDAGLEASGLASTTLLDHLKFATPPTYAQQ